MYKKHREITVWTTHCITSESFHKPSLTLHKKSWFFNLIRDQDSERNPASFHSVIPRSSRLLPGQNSMFSRCNLSCSSTWYWTQKSSRETSGIVNNPEAIVAGVGAALTDPGTVVGTASRSLLAIIACCCCNMLSIMSSINLVEVEGGAATGVGRATRGVTIAGVGASASCSLRVLYRLPCWNVLIQEDDWVLLDYGPKSMSANNSLVQKQINKLYARPSDMG